MERVVVTGIGVVTPFGVGVDNLWTSLLAKRNGISYFKHFEPGIKYARVGGLLPEISLQPYLKLIPAIFERPPEDEYIKIFFLAVDEAIRSSGFVINQVGLDKVGILVSHNRISWLNYIDQISPLIQKLAGKKKGFLRQLFDELEQHFVGKTSYYKDEDTLSHYISRIYNVTGPQLCISSLGTSSANAIGEAYHELRNGRLDCIIAGGAFTYGIRELLGLNGRLPLSKMINPDKACRPFDRFRSGYVLGSGCGILIMERLEKAKKRKANILCEVSGYATCMQTKAKRNIKGMINTIRQCMKIAGISNSDVNHINASGTAGILDDYMETIAIKSILKEYAHKIPISCTKSMIGHSMTATGAIEAIVSIKSILEGVIHPTRNCEYQEDYLDLDYVHNGPKEIKLNHVLSNNFNANGLSTCLCFSKYTK